VFFGVFENDNLKINEITGHYIYHNSENSECYFIGEILSDEEETHWAFQQFLKDRNPEVLLFLRGNYQTIIHISNELWCFSDIGNIRPIYYAKQDKKCLLSSHLYILNKQVVSGINTNWFGRSLRSLGFHTDFESPFKKINTIPGGFGLYVNKHRSQIFQSWNVDKEISLSMIQGQKQLKEELTSSILLRCENKKITTDLSGGFDSSTITWIASKNNPTQSVSIIGKEENEDIQIAREIAELQPNIHHIELSHDDIPSIYSDMDNIHTDIPIPFYWSANQAKQIINWAKENSSDIHFSGEGGDTVLGADYSYLIDLVHQWKWKTLFSHARGWAREKKQSPWNWILGSFLRASSLSFSPKQRHPLATSYNQANWLNVLIKSEKQAYSKKIGLSNTIRGIHYLGYVSHGLKKLAELEQVKLSFSYLDHNVIRTCIQIPLELKMTPFELKPLLKKAFEEDLPASLLERNTKGDYTSDVYHGMEENYSWFQENFQEMHLADMGLVDIQKFRECFQLLLIGAPIKLPEFHHTLSLEMWLRNHKKLK
jgi:asparagine synthetase B (glutamine-hydrolysing)